MCSALNGVTARYGDTRPLPTCSVLGGLGAEFASLSSRAFSIAQATDVEQMWAILNHFGLSVEYTLRLHIIVS